MRATNCCCDLGQLGHGLDLLLPLRHRHGLRGQVFHSITLHSEIRKPKQSPKPTAVQIRLGRRSNRQPPHRQRRRRSGLWTWVQAIRGLKEQGLPLELEFVRLDGAPIRSELCSPTFALAKESNSLRVGAPVSGLVGRVEVPDGLAKAEDNAKGLPRRCSRTVSSGLSPVTANSGLVASAVPMSPITSPVNCLGKWGQPHWAAEQPGIAALTTSRRSRPSAPRRRIASAP